MYKFVSTHNTFIKNSVVKCFIILKSFWFIYESLLFLNSVCLLSTDICHILERYLTKVHTSCV
jgi:hypothetical protein